MADAKVDSKRFTLARKEKQNADIIRKQNLVRIFLLNALNEDVEQEDMSVALQDGVLLCKIVNQYKPDSIKKYNANPRIPFKMMENAAFVLDFCKKNAIPVTFTAENVCNKENLILILDFILGVAESMGYTADTLSSSLDPRQHSPSPSSSPSSSPSPSPSSPPQSPPTTTTTTSPTIQKPKLGNGSNASPSSHVANNTLKNMFDDLIASEKEFIQEMELFFKLYVGPTKGILPTDKINNIFGNLENLVAANAKFLAELQMVQDGFMNIASVWDNFAISINIYSVYCIFQQNSLTVVEQCRREFPNFDAHLRAVEFTPESKNAGLFNFLVKPFGRVVKYNSVLKQLLQVVSPASEDHQSLTDVKKQFQDLHDTTNDTWKKVENSRKIAEIGGKLVGAEKAGLRKIGRVYLREGDFMLNGKPARLFLFSDILMYAAPVKAILKKSGAKTHIFKGIMQLNAVSFQDLPDGKDGKNLMEITTVSKSYKIQASSPSDKRLWVSDIKKCIAKLTGSSSPTPAPPLGPRPMLDVGRRGPTGPIRQDSQPQMLVEERRKTVKLSFGSTGGDDDDEDKQVIEEADEVQLQIKSGLTEEDKRKTIKLEFGVPRGQLSIRDRSPTVDLGSQFSIKDRSPTVDLGFKPNLEIESSEDGQLEENNSTSRVSFESPRQSSDTGSDQEEGEDGGDVVQEGADEGEGAQQEGEIEAKGDSEVEYTDNNGEREDSPEATQEDQDNEQEISEEPRDIPEDRRESPDARQESPDARQESYDARQESTDNRDDSMENTAEEEAQKDEHVEGDSRKDDTGAQAELDTSAGVELQTEENEQPSTSSEAPVEEQTADINQTQEKRDEDYVEDHTKVPENHADGHFSDAATDFEKAYQTLDSKSKQSDTDALFQAMREEITSLKEGLIAAHELAQHTAQELEKEKEETRVWKARVERILAVLLDTMKQNKT